MKYSEKLRNPKWQKKKNRILERDNYTCQHCGDTEKTLVVHHLEYRGEPWDVPDESLTTFCESCHDQVEEIIRSVRKLSKYPEIIMTIGELANLSNNSEKWFLVAQFVTILQRV